MEAEERISQLNKEIKVEHDGRVTAEKKIESTEQALVTLSQENAALEAKLVEIQKKLEANDAEFQAKLDETQKKLEANNAELQAKLGETQKKLEASEADLAGLKKLITNLLASVFGKLKTRLFCY